MRQIITLNGIEVSKDDSMLFGDLINKLSNELALKSEVISEIRINGKNIDESEESSHLMSQVGKLGEIEFITSNPSELAVRALDSAKEYINQILPICRDTGELYNASNKIPRPDIEKAFMRVIDDLDSLIDLLNSVQYILKGKSSVVNDSSLRIAQVRLTSAVQELLPAKMASDDSMLADILCNELPEALIEMRDFGIPVLMRVQST